MAKDIFSEYRESDKYGAPTEVEVARAKKFVFWHKAGWVVVGSAAGVYLATIIPLWLVFTILGIAGIIGALSGIIWLLDKNDSHQKTLKAAKQIGVRKDV